MTKQETRAAALADLAALTIKMTGGKVHLFKDDGFIPDETTTLAVLNTHEADYTGYVAGGVALAGPLGPYQDGVNKYSENFPTVGFIPTAPVLVSNDIKGVYFEDNAAGLQEYWIFDDPVTLATALDHIFVDPKFSYGNAPTNEPDVH